MRRNYYIPFNPGEKKDNNILYLGLCRLASYDAKTRRYNTIVYASLVKLAEELKDKAGVQKVSKPTLSRFLNASSNKDRLIHDAENKKIILLNDFTKYADTKETFVILSEQEILFLIEQNAELLIQYYLYLRYYCGIARGKEIDTTASQFLKACGYSDTSGRNKSLIASFNVLLEQNKFVSIRKSRDADGHERNYYTIIRK